MQRKSLLHTRAALGAALLATVTAMACGAFKGSDSSAPPDPNAAADGGEAGEGKDGETFIIGGDAAAGGDSGHCSLLVPDARVCEDFDTTADLAKFWTKVGFIPRNTSDFVSSPASVTGSTDVSAATPLLESTLSVGIVGPTTAYAVDFDYKSHNVADAGSGVGCTIFRIVNPTTMLVPALAELTIYQDRVLIAENGTVLSSLSTTAAYSPDAWAHVHLDVLFGQDGGSGARIHDVSVAFMRPTATVTTPTSPPPLVQFGVIATTIDCGVSFDNIAIQVH